MAQTDYEQLADRYDEDRERFAVPRDPVIEQLLAGGPARVLDLGCGTGRWLTAQAAAFVDAGLDLIGVDPSVGMLHAARSKRVPCLVCARAEELPLRGRTVDYVVTSFAFHHFVDKERALDEVTRLLRPDGVLRMVNIEPTTADRWWVHRFFPETRALDATRFWTPDRIFESLERRGFHVEIDVDTTVVPARQHHAPAPTGRPKALTAPSGPWRRGGLPAGVLVR